MSAHPRACDDDDWYEPPLDQYAPPFTQPEDEPTWTFELWVPDMRQPGRYRKVDQQELQRMTRPRAFGFRPRGSHQ